MSAKPKITGRATRDWQELDARHYLHPFTDFRALAAEGSRVITRGEGVHLSIPRATKILDAMSGLWCVNIGYGRNELADAAAKQMRELPYYNSFFKSANPPAIELAQLLDELTPPAVPPRVLHAVGLGGERHDPAHDAPLLGPDGPAEALGRHQPHQCLSRQHDGGGEPRRHGRHACAGRAADPGHRRTSSSRTGTRTASTCRPEEYGLRAARRLAEKIEEVGPERVAAFIGEPVQGAGGVIIPPSTYWPEIQRICREYGILLIADEVICGFGRTGQLVRSASISASSRTS